MMMGRRKTDKGSKVKKQDKGREVQCQLILKSFPGSVNQALLHLGSMCGMH